MNTESGLNRLTNYDRYWALSFEEKLVLLRLCIALDPDELEGRHQISYFSALFEFSTNAVKCLSKRTGLLMKRCCKSTLLDFAHNLKQTKVGRFLHILNEMYACCVKPW